MTISLKDSLKFFGITVTICCACFVCNMFLNYDVDLRAIADSVPSELAELYEASKLNDIVVCALSGGCLALTSLVMLIFYIGNYIQANSAKFGILKALGYSDGRIAVKCFVFGFCVLVGAVVGLGLSWAIMPAFYDKQNAGSVGLPQVVLHFHALPFVLLLVVPALFFSLFSVGVALRRLKTSPLDLIKGNTKQKERNKKRQKERGYSFIKELSLNVLGEKKVLAFFVAFGCFCFSSMMQMGLSMRTYASDMMGIIIFAIGMVLAIVSLYLSMSMLINGNKKKIAMLKVTGYSTKECALGVLGMYHIPACIGFALGCVYQYVLLVIMVNVVFASFDNVPEYSFDWRAFAVCLTAFIVLYEMLNLIYVYVISKSSIKSVMTE